MAGGIVILVMSQCIVCVMKVIYTFFIIFFCQRMHPSRTLHRIPPFPRGERGGAARLCDGGPGHPSPRPSSQCDPATPVFR